MISEWLGPIALFVTLAFLLVRLVTMLRGQSSALRVRFDAPGIEVVEKDGGSRSADFEHFSRRISAFEIGEVLQFDIDIGPSTRPVSLNLNGGMLSVGYEDLAEALGDGSNAFSGFAFAAPLMPELPIEADEAHVELGRLIIYATQVEQVFLAQPRTDAAALAQLGDEIDNRIMKARAVQLPEGADRVRNFVAAWLAGAAGLLLADSARLQRGLDGLRAVADDWPASEGQAFQSLLLTSIARLAVELSDMDAVSLSAALEASEAAQAWLSAAATQDGPEARRTFDRAGPDRVRADLALPMLRSALLTGKILQLRLGALYGDARTLKRAGDEMEELLGLADGNGAIRGGLLDARAALELARARIDAGKSADGLPFARQALAVLGWSQDQDRLMASGHRGFGLAWQDALGRSLDAFVVANWENHLTGRGSSDLAAAHTAITRRMDMDGSMPVPAGLLAEFADVQLAYAELEKHADLFATAQKSVRRYEDRAVASSGELSGDLDVAQDLRRLKAWSGLVAYSSDRSEVHLAAVRCREIFEQLRLQQLNVARTGSVAVAAGRLARRSGTDEDVMRMISAAEAWIVSADAGSGASDLRAAQSFAGNAYVTAAELRVGDRSAHLRLAEQAYERVLEGIDRAREPLTWSHYQMQRGGVLLQVGMGAKDPDAVKAGIGCFRAAEKVLTVERSPRQRLEALMRLGEGYVLLTALADPAAIPPCRPRDANASALKYLAQARDLSVLPELEDLRETCRRRLQAAELTEARLVQ